MLGDGLHDVAAGRVAAIVTHLEMRQQAALRPGAAPAGLTLQTVTNPAPEFYRDLYRRVGAGWLWFSRLDLDDAGLNAILHDPAVELMALMQDGVPQGMIELDFRKAGECELAIFGVTANLIGQGAGRYMMNAAITRAWQTPISLFCVHTCTLDSPGALGFYRQSGFTAVRQQVEISRDPRLSGNLPADAAQHIPIYRQPPASEGTAPQARGSDGKRQDKTRSSRDADRL